MSGDFDLIGGHYLREIRPGEVDIGVLHTDRVRTLPANTVIMVTHHEPNRYLADELEAEGIEVHAIGDAQGRNSIRNAIHEGAFLGRKV